METIPNTLTQITDVGAPNNNGVDSVLRIEKQYNLLSIKNPRIISAGHSPLHIAFAASTELSNEARGRAAQVLTKLNLKNNSDILPVALNCAPRNSRQIFQNSQEDHIYRVKFTNDQTFVLYGRELLRWLLLFQNDAEAQVEKIISIADIIPDTSSGSQFRSAEHLPIVHFLEAINELDKNSQREKVDIKKLNNIFPDKEKIIIAPADEYHNGRLIADKKLFDKTLNQKTIKIPEITNKVLTVKNSLTDIVPGELSVWPSSNHFLNETLGVLNIGTRWKQKTTKTTDKNTITLCHKLNNLTGLQCKFKF